MCRAGEAEIPLGEVKRRAAKSPCLAVVACLHEGRFSPENLSARQCFLIIFSCSFLVIGCCRLSPLEVFLA